MFFSRCLPPEMKLWSSASSSTKKLEARLLTSVHHGRLAEKGGEPNEPRSPRSPPDEKDSTEGGFHCKKAVGLIMRRMLCVWRGMTSKRCSKAKAGSL